MKLVLSGVAKENLNSGIGLNIPVSKRTKAIKTIYTKACSNMLDFIDLPDVPQKDIFRYQDTGVKISKKFKNFVVLGIGGSALGIKFLKDTFIDSVNKHLDINIHVCDNIDSDSFISLLDSLDLKKTMFNVITKSGTTSETLSQMMIVINRYKRKKIDFSSHFIVTTTEGNSLYKFAVSNNIDVFTIPNGVGGRFSVLSSVGLLPAAVMGIDIQALLKGARIARENSKVNEINNISYTCAHIAYTYLTKGLTNLVVMPYSDRLRLFPDFFAQLWGESLGKKNNREGKVVYAGQTPIKTLGVTDQHSQLQLYAEGIKDKLIMFITVDKVGRDEVIADDFGLGKHLKGASLKTLLDYEYASTAFALTKNNRPNFTLALDVVNEETMGELIYMAELMTAYMGELLDIDAFDQPGVELSKIYTKACLKHPGMSAQEREIKAYMSHSKKFTIN